MNSGITGIQLFIQAIPYNFYSLLTIVFIIVIVVMGFDYGPMARAEIEAYRDGMLGSLGSEEKLDNPRSQVSLTCSSPSSSSSYAASSV